MSDRQPTDDDLLLEALEAAQTGNGASAAAAARLGHDRALQAELEGLKAVQDLLKQDAAWGQASGADAPPPQLLEAILRAEVLARPEAIRAAVVARADQGTTVGGAPAPPSTTAGLWSKVSSWLLGGGVVVGATAALLLTVSRAPMDVAAPKAEAAAQLAPALPVPADPATTAATTPPAPDSAPGGLHLEEGLGRAAVEADRAVAAATSDVERKNRLEKAVETRAAAPATPADKAGAAGDRFADGSVGGSTGYAFGDAAGAGLGGGGLAKADAAAGPKGASAPMKDALALDADDEAEAPRQQPSPPPPPAEMAAEPAPMAPTTTMPPPAPAKPAPRIVSAAEAQQNFLRARAKAEALVDAKETAKSEAKAKAKAPVSAAKKSASDALEDAGKAREQMARDQRLQEANGVLVTAERELQFGRFAGALDLAQQAEALAGGGLGLAPASTQARAWAGLKRFADAARVASRLLQGSVADPQLVDGMLAGADAAVAIGDLRLAERLLVRASSMENPDVARRAEAKRRLQALNAKAAAAPARESAAPAATSADSP